MSTDTQRITITLPKDVYSHIKEQAERDIRTIGEEITYLLRLHVPSYSTPEPFTKPILAENPTNAPTLTNDTTAYYKKRKEIL